MSIMQYVFYLKHFEPTTWALLKLLEYKIVKGFEKGFNLTRAILQLRVAVGPASDYSNNQFFEDNHEVSIFTVHWI